MIKKICLQCKKEYECEGECKISDRINDIVICCCKDCIVSKTNWGSLEKYEAYAFNQNTPSILCRSRFGTAKEKVVFT